MHPRDALAFSSIEEQLDGVHLQEGMLRDLAKRFLKRIARRVDYAWGTVYYLNREKGLLEPLAHRGEELDFIRGFSFAFGTGLSAWIAEQKKTITLRNIHHGRRHRHHPVRAFASFPILAGTVSLGTLTLGHSDPRAFDDEQCAYLERATRRFGRTLLNLLYPSL